MKAALNRIAALLGYVPAPAKLAPSVITMELDFEIDSAPLDTAIAKLDQAAEAARRAEAAINDALMAQAGEFIESVLVADDSQAPILAELRRATTLLEVLAKQGDRASQVEPATGAAASGLPG
ncbi:hypothetical protein ASF61_06665 [Duganella sp. Leaf126]|uniref:hypothetical protein n=1 Tax=Duganella sp. Leaf126 TaxID=1736266 RepID=UPI0006FEDC3D|nr:hypothetical protein [Duganella sp. Leaf126]KQQ40430.1 hypothetical protein ASF61_06665 [Duganella sp. Leaf126]